MKKLLFILVAFITTQSTTYAQGIAPITGPTSECVGNLVALADATPGGTWSTSGPGVAYINPATGLISGLSAGLVNVTYTVGASHVTMLFTVRALPVLTPDSLHGCVGHTYVITAVPNGGGWVSSNPAVAAVNYVGAVTGVAPGNATISYTAAGGCISSIPVTINPLPLPITGSGFVYTGFATTLSDITPGGLWSTTDPSLAVVSGSGIVTGVSAGLVLISYTLPSTGCASLFRMDVDPLPGTTSLYAWYPFCGDTTDQSFASGGGPHPLLNYLGTPATLTSDRFGNAGNAYNFSGGTCHMEFSTFFPNPGVPPDFTYSCWINPSVPQSSIVLYNGNPNSDGYGFVINDGTPFPGGAGTFVSVYFAGVGTFLPIDLSAGGFVFNAWHNLVLVKSGNSYRLYIDDISEGFFIATFINPSVGSVFALGGNASGAPLGPLGFQGDIDDVAYITRQLTTAERLSMYSFNPDARHFTLGNDTTICSDAITLAPRPQTVGGAYAWKTYVVGAGYVVTDTLDTAYTVYPLPGIVGNSYALTVSKPYGCSAADTITVYKNPIPVHLVTNPLTGPGGNFCQGDTLNLTTTVSFPGSSVLWSTGETTHAIEVTTTGTYYITVDSVIHLGPGDSAVCVGRDTIYLHASRVPLVTAVSSVINCTGNPDTVFTHADPGYTYLWSNGYVGDSGIISSSGTFWVHVTDSGCSRGDTFNAVIIDESVTLFNHDTAICLGDKVLANASFNPTVTYQWTPTAGMATSNLSSVFIVPDTSAEYRITVSFPGCPDIVDSFHIDVQPRPSVNLGGSRDVCEGDTIHINANVAPKWYHHYLYNWSPVNANLNATDSSYVVFTAHTRNDSEEIIVKVYPPVFLSNIGDSLCYSVDSAAIYVHPSHFIKFDTTDYNFCPGDSLQFHPIDTGAIPGMTSVGWHWTPGVYLDDSFANRPWIHPITSLPYRLIATSIFGCRDTQYVHVTVHPAAVINLGDSLVLAPGESHQIQPQTNCVNFLWFPPLGLNNDEVSDPIVTPQASTTYTVQASTEDGCKVIDSIRVHVDPGTHIEIPNAFTPDATINNVFKIIKSGLVGINYFRIFDRWGNKVFETNDKDKGWDGTYNGKQQPFGVYVYDIEAITSTGQVFHREGNVTLIR